MAKLIWNPQKSFKPYFNDAKGVKKYRSVFREGFKYFSSYGGRASGKTFTFADAVAIEGTLRPVRILITRELQVSIKESIKDEIEDAIRARGLEHFYDMQDKVINGINGTRFIFKGLRNNIKNLKSISNVDIVLVEEAQDVPEDSWSKLLPSIRPKSGREPVFIIIFNPGSELDATYKRWAKNPPRRCVSRLLNYYDNEYLPEFLDEQREEDKRTMPKEQYEHEWLGKPKGSSGDVIISQAWISAARFASKNKDWVKRGRKIVGYDPAGQGRDYNAAVFIDGNELKVIDEWLRSPDLKVASIRAHDIAVDNNANAFIWDDCGGFGDGVSVFVKDAKRDLRKQLIKDKRGAEAIVLNKLAHHPFNAGDGVHRPEKRINGSKKTNKDIYANLKAQTWAILAQQLYNTYRFIELGYRDINPEDMLSIDIEDDEMFEKLMTELSCPLWIKAEGSSKKKVEPKDAMKKRTEQPSPNIADAVVMTRTPKLPTELKDVV